MNQKFLNYSYEDYCKSHLNESKVYNKLPSYISFIQEKYKNYPLFLTPEHEQKQLYEGYYHSSTVYQLAHGLKKVIPAIQCRPLVTGNLEIRIPLQNWNHKSSQTQFKNVLNVCGYFIAVQETRQHPYTNERLVLMELEARYNEQDLSDTVYNEYHGIVYHLTPSPKANKILKYGLSPKSQNKLSNHPERIYFTLSDDRDFIQTMTEDLNNAAGNKYASYTLLRIDLNKNNTLLNTGNLYQRVPVQVRLFRDAALNEPLAVYTLENIAPDAISIQKIIKI